MFVIILLYETLDKRMMNDVILNGKIPHIRDDMSNNNKF